MDAVGITTMFKKKHFLSKCVGTSKTWKKNAGIYPAVDIHPIQEEYCSNTSYSGSNSFREAKETMNSSLIKSVMFIVLKWKPINQPTKLTLNSFKFSRFYWMVLNTGIDF